MTVVGYAGGLAIKKCTSASALSPQLLLVRRESGCTGVYRSDSLDTLMQEERAHFRVDAIGGESGAPFCLFEFASVWGVV